MADFELKFIRASDVPIQSGWDESTWNGWRLDDGELAYPAYPGGGVYPIGIERFTSSAEMLNMIMQVAHKEWATDACLAGLVRALDQILQPQAKLCCCGSDKRMTAADIRQLLKQ